MKEHCSSNFSAPSVVFILALPVDLVIFVFLLFLVVVFIVAVWNDHNLHGLLCPVFIVQTMNCIVLFSSAEFPLVILSFLKLAAKVIRIF